MASKGGVIVTIDGVDRTGEVFASIKKHNEELKISAKETSESLGQIGESLKHGLEAAGIAVGVKELISQLHEAVTEATEFGESIAKAGERTGIAAGTLSVLHYAAAVTSTDFDKLVTASGKMGKNLADAADGNKKLEAAFQKIGVTARDVVGRHDALDIVIQHLGKTLAETESPARRLQVAGDLLGKSGQDTCLD
jgi:translation elongation factor EF-1alpha